MKRTMYYGNTHMFDWIQEVDALSPQTKFPLWLLVMSSEACRMGQTIWILEKLGVL